MVLIVLVLLLFKLPVLGPPGFEPGTIVLGFGLCHRRCEARFAGQLKTLSHSGHLYSTCTIMEHLPGGKKNSVNDRLDHLHT